MVPIGDNIEPRPRMPRSVGNATWANAIPRNPSDRRGSTPRMRPASNVEWERWGETDPFFGVATWAGHERAGATPWTPEGF